jgi:hypothetical protein
MLATFTFKRHIIILIRLHFFLSTQEILRGILTVGLVVIKNKKDVQKRSNFDIEIIIIFAIISTQSVKEKVIPNAALIA